MRSSSVTEVQVGFSDLISAQVFWASLEDPTQYHLVRIQNRALDGEVLAYLVVRNKD